MKWINKKYFKVWFNPHPWHLSIEYNNFQGHVRIRLFKMVIEVGKSYNWDNHIKEHKYYETN